MPSTLHPPAWMDLGTLAEHICLSADEIDKAIKEEGFPSSKQRNGKTLWKWSEVDRHLVGEDAEPNLFH